jgi:hypothetical protein
MKNRFAAIFMISGILTIAIPVLAHASVEPNQIVQGLNIVRAVVEWVVLVGLIFSTIIGSWLVVNRPSDRTKYLMNFLIAPIALGILAGGTAILLENWTLFLLLDACFALALVAVLLIVNSSLQKINEEDLVLDKGELREEYDLKNLKIRKLGSGRKSFWGQIGTDKDENYN